jgi:excisionase family DNA binding protein
MNDTAQINKPKPPRPAGALKTIAETAAFLGLSRWTVVSMLENGMLPGIVLRTGRRKKIWRISEPALTKWLQAKEIETKRRINNGGVG